ncbi:MAG: BACON domain-containing protein [Synergistaceae bacterium]|nr:BACON domain-containing protein [Synergistaceae bacterium]
MHSFADGTDYYLIKLNSTTNPSNQFADVTNREICGDNYKSNHVSGYTRQLYWSHSVSDSAHNDDVTIIQHSPETLNSSRTHSEGFTHNFSGSIGFSGTNASGSFSGGVSYSTTDTTTIYDYVVNNRCLEDNLSTARWAYVFSLPADGEDHINLTDDYQEVNATTASRTTHTAHIDWIYAVKPVYWDTHNKLNIGAMYSFMDGKTNGKHFWILWYHHSRDDYSYDWVNNEFFLTLDKPHHIAINNSANVNLTKSAGQGTFNLLSDKSWEITADQDWITSFNYTSGEGTGDSPVAILYDVAENTTGVIRNANIIITASDGEKCTVKISQSGN